jgi:hypothetical protein
LNRQAFGGRVPDSSGGVVGGSAAVTSPEVS